MNIANHKIWYMCIFFRPAKNVRLQSELNELNIGIFWQK